MIVTHILSVANLVAARSIQLAALMLIAMLPFAQPAKAFDANNDYVPASEEIQ